MGNKSDLDKQGKRQVTVAQGKELVDELTLTDFSETCAFEQPHMEKLFEGIKEKIIANRAEG